MSTTELLTPTEVAGVLKISPKSVIARFSGMQGVLTLPNDKQRRRAPKVKLSAEEYRRRPRDSYQQIRIPTYVLDKFIESNTVKVSTDLNVAKNRKKVRTN